MVCPGGYAPRKPGDKVGKRDTKQKAKGKRLQIRDTG